MEDLGVKCYKNHMSRSRVKGISCAILWSFKIYSRIVIRLEAIEYKEDFSY